MKATSQHIKWVFNIKFINKLNTFLFININNKKMF